MEKEFEQIEIRSEEVQEILGHPPRWLIRWGVTLLFLVVVLLLIGSYFYKYPEIISSTIVINTENMPAIIVSKTSGKIEKIFISDNQYVEEKMPLAIIENGANFSDVLLLKQLCDTIKVKLNSRHIEEFPKIGNLILGDIQPSFITFVKSLSDLEIYQETSYLEKKVANLNLQLLQYQSLLSKYINQSLIYKEQLEIANIQFQRDSVFYKSAIISKSDWEKSKSVFLQSKLSFENSKVAIDNMKITITQTEHAILELDQQNFEQRSQLIHSLQSSIDNLQNTINNWFLNFVLTAPISGKVVFTSFWQKNQNVIAGNEVFSIIPAEESKIVGKIKLPIQGSGKVKVGQKVNVKIDNFPYMEYGIVKGLVSSISLMPSENYYSVEIVFPSGLLTSYNKEIEFGQNLQGSAEIITEDIRLIERFIQPIKNILTNH